MGDEEYDFGSDIEIDDELEAILDQAESQAAPGHANTGTSEPTTEADLEDIVPRLSPFLEFRKKGWLSVSDLVGTVWCEVQYDYRLRTLPFLPPEKRPNVITSKEGIKVPVDKVKVEDKERILKRGEKIHKRLEREIHPEEIIVHAVTREDVWGLRFLNMFSALEALITLGKCRELPVVGFVKGILVMGIIDEVTRQPVDETTIKPNTRSSAPDKKQTSLTSFFSPTKPRPVEIRRERTHKLFVSDSKTRASGTVPKESDTLAGRLQAMLYKELLDALLLPPAVYPYTNDKPDTILPTETPFSWNRLFDHLQIDMDEPFSESFIAQSRPIIMGNGLRYTVDSAKSLREMIECWKSYTDALGLGMPINPGKGPDQTQKNTGRTEDRLELVYRRAGAKHRNAEDTRSKTKDRKERTARASRRKKRKSDGRPDEQDTQVDQDQAIQQAIEASLRDVHQAQVAGQPTEAKTAEVNFPEETITADDNHDTEEDELAWAIEMSLGATATDPVDEQEIDVVVRASQVSAQTPSSPSDANPSQILPPRLESTQQSSTRREVIVTEEESSKSGSGSIIGRTSFTHSPRRLAGHLASVLEWWMGERDAVGVSVDETRRCGWCEFEEGCEWRNKKAQEAMERFRAVKNTS